MVKIWIKNRMIYDIMVAIILSLIFSFAFVFPNNVAYKNIENENFLYLKSEIDFQIPNPSVNQLAEIKSKPYVNDVFGYYLTKVSIKGNNSSKVNLLISDTMDSLPFTMYNKKTLISSIDKTSNYAYIDKKAADTLNVECGDEIVASIANYNLKFIVCSIYQNNTLFLDGTVLVNFADDVKTMYETNASSNGYSAAFIDASNEDECEKFLKNYIPMGRLRDRSYFDSDEAYNIYTNAIMNGDYSNEITKFESSRKIALKELDTAEKNRTFLIYAGSIVVGICWLLSSFILRKRNFEMTYFKNVIKNKKSIKTYRLCTLFVSVGTFIAFTVVTQMFLSTLLLTMIPIIIILVFFVASYIINIIFDKLNFKMKAK